MGIIHLSTLYFSALAVAWAQDGTAQFSSTIKSAGAATLWNGNGDVSASGACESDAKFFCKDVTAGEGRLAECLSKRVVSLKKGNVIGRKVGTKCVKELLDFKMDKSAHINKDVPLARACEDEAAKYCKDANDNDRPASVVSCLRENTEQLGTTCKNEVIRVQRESVEDYRTDYRLYTACKYDVQSLCADVEPGDGRELECLATKRYSLSVECESQVAKQEKETGADIRLSKKLFDSCQTEVQKRCKDVPPGNMRAQQCLEDHMEDSDFSTDCKKELENIIAKRVSDFQLDTPIREACKGDLANKCHFTLSEMDRDPNIRVAALKCLQDYKQELGSEQCKSEVHRRMVRASKNILFDEVLANACHDDRLNLCNDVQPGSARVIRCLQDNRKALTQRCAAALFDKEVRMSEDIDFNFGMKRTCAYEINQLCHDIPQGQARVIRCLEEQTDHPDMSKECRQEVQRSLNAKSKDYRLNYRLSRSCESDIDRLCADACTTIPGQFCGGLVLHCLQTKQDNITSQACQDEVFYYQLMEVKDYRNDIILAEACRGDVDLYCRDVEPGQGRVHLCLRFNRDKLTERCRAEETKLAAIEYSDIRLATKLNKLCSEERAVYCKDVKPGKARVVKCLIENMAQPNFGEDCKENLQQRDELMKSDIRYDVGVNTNCAADVDTYCKDARTKLRGNATILRCLAENFNSLAAPCQSEMSRSVRLALWDYRPGVAFTGDCDKDVELTCPKKARGRSGAVFTIGVVGRCLSKALVEGKYLEDKCRNLVLIAAPKDVRSYFDSADSTSAIIQKITSLQNAAGMESLLVDPRREGSTVTVTGWVALACIISLIIVSIGGSYILYQRFMEGDKKEQYLKMGDA